jgi:SH3 domain-containing YSC84-like protein 1
MAAGSLTFGGNMSVALGPLGRNGEAASSVNTSGSVAMMHVMNLRHEASCN